MAEPFVSELFRDASRVGRTRPHLMRLVAPNASPMTFTGTNTYLLGERNLAVIDPGPDDSKHLSAILNAVPEGAKISGIFVTHSHLDHSALAPRLAAETGAKVVAYGNSLAGRSDAMNRLAEEGDLEGGEGVDRDFEPDEFAEDGQEFRGDGWTIEAVWTPGHFGNHLCLAWNEENVLFSGDHLMAWSTTLISPPDGDVSAFRSSLHKLGRRSSAVLLPGHGPPVEDSRHMIAHQLEHRERREAQIVAALEQGPATARDLAAKIYTETPSHLLRAAARNVLAHLIDLKLRNVVSIEGNLEYQSTFKFIKQ